MSENKIAAGVGGNSDEFMARLCREIFEGICRYYEDNTDSERIGSATGRIQDALRSGIIRLWSSWSNQKLLAGDLFGNMKEGLHTYLERLSDLYNLLACQESKSLFVKVVAFRILGKEHCKLPLNTRDYWEKRRLAGTLVKGDQTISVDFLNWKLSLLSLDKIGYPIELYLLPMMVCARFMVKSYEYENSGVCIKAAKSDVVIDAGGCWGDTALYFAHEVGDAGKVYSFEFVPGNLRIMEVNLNLNPRLKDRVEVVRKPVWNKSGETLYFSDNGPGSIVSEKRISKRNDSVITVSIDDYVDENMLARLDFIKMDIEGAELDALRGAERSIRKFRPKLAISLYHDPSDFITIPQFLFSLDLGYEFYLGHYTIHSEETVLFAVTRR